MEKVTITNDVKLVVTGTIVKIGEVQGFSNGAQKVDFVVKNNEGYNGGEQVYAFDFYKGPDKLDQMEKFIKFKKVGSKVDVNFNIKCNEGKGRGAGRYFTNLSAWSVFEHKDEEPENYDDVIGDPAADDDENLPF